MSTPATVNQTKKTQPKLQEQQSDRQAMYSVFHTILFIVALYLSFKCNRGFNLGSFLLACCCPMFYIPYILATKGFCSTPNSVAISPTIKK